MGFTATAHESMAKTHRLATKLLLPNLSKRSFSGLESPSCPSSIRKTASIMFMTTNLWGFWERSKFLKIRAVFEDELCTDLVILDGRVGCNAFHVCDCAFPNRYTTLVVCVVGST